MNGKRPLSTAEYQKIHNYLYRHNRYRDLAMASLCYHTGYRINEILTVQVKDVINVNGQYRNSLYISPRKMKKKSPRMPIPLREELKQDLSLLIAELRRDGDLEPERFLIQSQKGDNRSISYTQAYRIIVDVFDACNIFDNVAVHSFRKSFCEDIFEKSDNNIVMTQRIMGHSSPITTLKYIRVNEEKLNEIILNS